MINLQPLGLKQTQSLSLFYNFSTTEIYLQAVIIDLLLKGYCLGVLLVDFSGQKLLM